MLRGCGDGEAEGLQTGMKSRKNNRQQGKAKQHKIVYLFPNPGLSDLTGDMREHATWVC